MVRFRNHAKTVAGPPLLTDRYVRPEMDAVMRTHQYGTPVLLQRRRNLGACPFWARAKRYRDPVYRKAFADEEADVKMTALMIDGRTGIPAF